MAEAVTTVHVQSTCIPLGRCRGDHARCDCRAKDPMYGLPAYIEEGERPLIILRTIPLQSKDSRSVQFQHPLHSSYSRTFH